MSTATPRLEKASASNRVAHDLRDKIERGIYRPGTILPGRRALSAAYQVALVTIEQSVRQLSAEGLLRSEQGRGTFVVGNAGFAEPIASMDIDGGQENAASANAGLRLGLFIQDMRSMLSSDSYAAQAVHGVQAALAPFGMRHSLIFIDEAHLDSIPSMPASKVSGLLFVAPHTDMSSRIDWFARSILPTVVIGASWPGISAGFVDCDNTAGLKAAIDRLFELGHRRIACTPTHISSFHHLERERVFLDEMARRGVDVPREYTLEFWKPEGSETIEAVRNLLASPVRPTALIVPSPFLAGRVLQIAHAMELQVPRDFSLVTFDDTAGMLTAIPPISSIAAPFEQMGRDGMTALIEMCEKQSVSRIREVLPMDVRFRESIGTVPSE
ncbi:MAG: GntR family transcriptional regulator [Capsulimonadaceae bacterium]|nr:GntR family transcriptional regulator [Capsulimonadaceae bacterium]